MFNDLLSRRTTKKTNFFTADQLFSELQRLSNSEAECFRYMMERKRSSKSIAFVALDLEQSKQMFAVNDGDTVVSTARAVADRLAEESGKLGFVAYADRPERNLLYQFRLRRSSTWKEYDLRNFLAKFSIKNGGGHEGAIGFRIPRAEVPDLEEYVQHLIQGIEEVIGSGS
jgi:single-stranded DNA-specific DHH superfamily exonuclease